MNNKLLFEFKNVTQRLIANHEKKFIEKTERLYKHLLDNEYSTYTKYGTYIICEKLGQLLMEQGKLEESEKYYRKALELKPDADNVFRIINDPLIWDYKFEEAEKYCRKFLELEPNNIFILFNLDDALVKQGKLEEAEKYYRKFLELEPDNILALDFLSKALVRQGKLEEAEKYCCKALELEPDCVSILSSLCNALVEQGKLEEALPHIQKVLRLAKGTNNEELLKISKTQLEECLAKIEDIQPNTLHADLNL